LIQELAINIKNILETHLPGEKAQLLMSSEIRINEFVFKKESEKSKKCGVMILLYPVNNIIYSVLILRTEYEGIHSGQVALPGGKYEKNDLNLVYTAIRETSEEIGINNADIKIIGQLSKLYIPPSDYVVYPSIGFVQQKPEFILNTNEVKEIIEYPIKILLNDAIIKSKDFHINTSLSFKAPYFQIENQIVWGATAMILSEFKEILKTISLPLT